MQENDIWEIFRMPMLSWRGWRECCDQKEKYKAMGISFSLMCENFGEKGTVMEVKESGRKNLWTKAHLKQYSHCYF